MRRRAILLLTLVAAVLLASSGVVLAQQGEARAPLQERAESHIPNQYIVVL